MTVVHAEEILGDGLASNQPASPSTLMGSTRCSLPELAPRGWWPANPRIAEIIRAAADLNIVGGDAVEAAPEYDATTNTAQAAAQMLFEIF